MLELSMLLMKALLIMVGLLLTIFQLLLLNQSGVIDA